MTPQFGFALPHHHGQLIAGLIPVTALPQPKPSSVTITAVEAEQISQLVDHVYDLGKRPVFEAFAAVHAGAPVIETLQEYQRLDPIVVRFLGADRLPRRRQRNGCRHHG